jgi:aryl-alcohol dehydrogenase-like predicted oxidoreductase
MMDAQRSIGRIPVSLAGVGCNNFGRRIDEGDTLAVVDAALDAGVALFDTADLYGDGASEEFLGRALGARRDGVVIVSKFGMRAAPNGLSGGSSLWVGRACEASLRRLGTDRIDVYLLHQPDPSTPIGDTLQSMAAMVDEGKVREIGCSNFSATQLDDAAKAAADLGVPAFANGSPRPRYSRRASASGSASCPTFHSRAGCSRASTAPALPDPPGRGSRTPERERNSLPMNGSQRSSD